MASASTSTVSSSGRYNKQQLEDMKRSDLQKVFKTEGLKGANQKSEILIDVLLSHFGNAVQRTENGAFITRGKENVGPGPGTPKRSSIPMSVPLPNAKQGKVVAELQAQIAQLGNEISSLKNETDPRVAVLQTRVEVLEARDAEWTERLAAAEVKWAESMASVMGELDRLKRAAPSTSTLHNITEEGFSRPLRHSSVPATPLSSVPGRVIFPPSATSLGKRRRDEMEADDAVISIKSRVISTASAMDAGDVDDGLLEDGLKTPPRASSKAADPRTPPPGVHSLPRDLPSPSPAQKKRTLSGLGHASAARLVSSTFVPPPSPRADRSSPAPRLHSRIPSARIDALFGPQERPVIPLEPMHAPFNDPSSTPTAIDRAIDHDNDPPFVASPIIPDLLGPELSRLSPFPAPTPSATLQVPKRKMVPPTPPAMPTLFGTERSRDTRFGDEPF